MHGPAWSPSGEITGDRTCAAEGRRCGCGDQSRGRPTTDQGGLCSRENGGHVSGRAWRRWAWLARVACSCLVTSRESRISAPDTWSLAVEESWEARSSRLCTPHLTGRRHIGRSCEGLTPDAASYSAFCHGDPHLDSPFRSSMMVPRRGSEPSDYL